MILNQEFGDQLYTPTGISGDLSIGHESGSDASRKALLAQAAFMSELVDRSAVGQTTPDEDALLARVFSADQAHGHN